MREDARSNLRYGMPFEPGPWTDFERLESPIESVAAA